MNNIDPELLKRLDALARKFGAGAGDAWQILIRQAYVDACSWLPWLLLWAVTCVAMHGLFTTCRAKMENDRGDDDGVWGIGAALCIIAFVCGAIGIIDCVSSMMVILLNPQGYVLREILSYLR